ncbi:phospholipase/carboxylesterase [Tamilnaduibacter salinus]|uniref:Carboxylesterase n=1 Tax=Tamilnaduibacter salinus TaxID=1484056 RepID=A0A2A2I310_9GAMM|nr:alpha/beta fold hydrolase [Tamilnaduibacter salinus]PAV26411.1 carboxylesterase [Tamilnaduibacter salinus]PVY78150.1 phospholipase/carboxylesterase [Tamilnaduibacter salinus]
MTQLQAIEMETGANPDAAVIWLHGLGASGHDFEPVVPELKLPDSAAVRFIFPHAPTMPVTINGGMQMPAWHDIKSLDLERAVDEAQIRHSADLVREFIEQERERGVPSERIVLAGFSQGGAVAYELALSYPDRLAGLMALSSYFATNATIQRSEANQGLPIRVYHGTQDPMVPEALGRHSESTLRELGYNVRYQTFPMDHSVCLEEIQDIGAFLREILAL